MLELLESSATLLTGCTLLELLHALVLLELATAQLLELTALALLLLTGATLLLLASSGQLFTPTDCLVEKQTRSLPDFSMLYMF
jgi:hypothetical protein